MPFVISHDKVLEYLSSNSGLVGWFDSGWMSGAHKSCSIPALLSWTGKENMRKDSGVEIRTEGDPSPNIVMGKTTWGNGLILLPTKSEQDNGK